MEAIITIAAAVVLTIAAIIWERQYTAGDPARTYRVTRTAYTVAVVFGFMWIIGVILAWPLVQDVGVALVVPCGAVAADTSQRLTKKR